MRDGNSGFTLVEVVLALALVAVSVIALAPLFVYAARETASAARVGTAAALAVQRMEILRATPFAELVNGGALDANVSGYHEQTTDDCTLRWTIADKPGGPAPAKILTVHALPSSAGRSRLVELVTVRAN